METYLHLYKISNSVKPCRIDKYLVFLKEHISIVKHHQRHNNACLKYENLRFFKTEIAFQNDVIALFVENIVYEISMLILISEVNFWQIFSGKLI